MPEAWLDIPHEGVGETPSEAADKMVSKWLHDLEARTGQDFSFHMLKEDIDCVEEEEGPNCNFLFELHLKRCVDERDGLCWRYEKFIAFDCSATLTCEDYEDMLYCSVTDAECITYDVKSPDDPRIALLGLEYKP